ncbi:hypothetical protein [Saccharopolyspora gloriosae]|uniref:hypothetical protein n=1 Tax=Saccharopolyspora gloriosae TaxID=455344 RepID=UPI0028681EF3|nr:hypothetical protein [Saccharopolyspora gloriosae]
MGAPAVSRIRISPPASSFGSVPAATCRAVASTFERSSVSTESMSSQPISPMLMCASTPSPTSATKVATALVRNWMVRRAHHDRSCRSGRHLTWVRLRRG